MLFNEVKGGPRVRVLPTSTPTFKTMGNDNETKKKKGELQNDPFDSCSKAFETGWQSLRGWRDSC